MEKTFREAVTAIQTELKAPKDKYNTFGKYAYRSAEGILEAVKPLLNKHGLFLTISDSVEAIGNRIYIKATVTLTDGKDAITTSAYAREEEVKKGMDGSQITGTASSYARKYAMNGLFCIDDTKDADALNTSAEYTQKPQVEPVKKDFKTAALAAILSARTQKELMDIYNANETFHSDQEFMAALTARKNALNNKK